MKSSEFEAYEDHSATLELFYFDGLRRLNCFSSSLALVIFMYIHFAHSFTVCKV